MHREIIKIQMLGGFRISSREFSIEEGTKRTLKIWRLLKYLIIFRNKTISQDELLSAIWTNDDQKNPKNAMHNMIFRIRKALIDSGLPYGKDMIVNNGGAYAWNNNLNCTVDCEEFDKLYHKALAYNGDKKAKLETLLKAVELYKGDFLPNTNGEAWVVPLTSYYRNAFIHCIHIILERLIEQENYLQAELLCKKTLLIDQFDEKINEYHLRAIIRQDKQKAALAEYRRIADVIYNDLGTEPSEALSALYMDIHRRCNETERSLDEMVQDWLNPAGVAGAYYCEYGLFKYIYQLEARTVMRSGQTAHIFSVSLKNMVKKHEESIVMENLHDVIIQNLRKEDLFTRSAPKQFVVMVRTPSQEGCKIAADRIKRILAKKHPSCTLDIKIRPVDSIE